MSLKAPIVTRYIRGLGLAWIARSVRPGPSYGSAALVKTTNPRHRRMEFTLYRTDLSSDAIAAASIVSSSFRRSRFAYERFAHSRIFGTLAEALPKYALANSPKNPPVFGRFGKAALPRSRALEPGSVRTRCVFRRDLIPAARLVSQPMAMALRRVVDNPITSSACGLKFKGDGGQPWIGAGRPTPAARFRLRAGPLRRTVDARRCCLSGWFGVEQRICIRNL